MRKVKTAVIGVGYLGKYHAEKYSFLPNSELVAVCDTNLQQCQEVATSHGVAAVTDYRDLIGQVEAVTIAVPTLLHHQVAKVFLANKVHVLVEKPIASTVAEAEELIALANANQVVLQVGHLERFNCALQALHTILDRPRFIESYRLAPFRPRGTDVNVVLDLMIHDIDIIQDIVGAPISRIAANGATVLSNHTDIANARIEFANGCVANVTASRVSAKIERKLRIFQHDAFISLDLHNKSLDVHRKGVSEMFPGIPEIIREEQSFEPGDALRDEVMAFLESIIYNKPPVVSGEDGKAALATAIEITRIVNEQTFNDSEELAATDAA
ncbi:MAG: Gfo/Idh/MocA family oxidoreductase [Coxiellaceae bacterium]|nr:MAG: Gfo/Idh/MocA family oxidoreductase [Coxiellaceae bacterium]